MVLHSVQARGPDVVATVLAAEDVRGAGADVGVLVSEAPSLEPVAESSVSSSPSPTRAEDVVDSRRQASAPAQRPGSETEAELAPMYYI